MSGTCMHLLARPGAASCPSCGCDLNRAIAPTIAPEPEPEEVEDEAPEPSWDEAAAEVEVPMAFDTPWAGRAERARRKLSWFFREAWLVLNQSDIELEWNWHIEAICDHIQWILEDWIRAKRDPQHLKVRMQNAYFSLPPGCLKTRIIMEAAPAWMWLRDPTWTVRCLSVNPGKALESADNMRRLVTSKWYQEWFEPDWEMREDQDAKGNFGNTRGGARYSAGITAKIVGSRTDALFVDDPNDPMTDDEGCDKINALWDSTLGSRVNDRRISVCVIVQQRIHVNDLTGHVAKKRGWSGLVLPLLFDPGRRCATLFGWADPRELPGECLHPVRYTEDIIAYMRFEEYGERMFEAQCQQNPSALDGDIFKMGWFNFWRRSDSRELDVAKRGDGFRKDPASVVEVDRFGVLDVETVCVTVDATGGSTAEDASHVGLLICATKDNKRLVLDDLGHGPRDLPGMVADLQAAIPRAANLTGKRRVHVLVEKKALGVALTNEIEQRIKGMGYQNAAGESIAVTWEDYEPANTNASKVARAQAMEVPMALGEIYVLEGAAWLPVFFAEFKRFPKKPNDRVDALAQFVDKYRRKKGWRDVFGPQARAA